jgi:hypothetical protein
LVSFFKQVEILAIFIVCEHVHFRIYIYIYTHELEPMTDRFIPDPCVSIRSCILG